MSLSIRDQENMIKIVEEMFFKEDLDAGTVFGDVPGHGGDIENSDWYAQGDARIPLGMGLQTRFGKRKKKNTKKKKRKSLDNSK